MKLEFSNKSRMFCVDLRIEHSFSTFWLCIFRISHFFQKKYLKQPEQPFLFVIGLWFFFHRNQRFILHANESRHFHKCFWTIFYRPFLKVTQICPNFSLMTSYWTLTWLWDFETNFFGFSRHFYIEIHWHDICCTWWDLLNNSFLDLPNPWNGFKAFIKMLRWRHSREFLPRWRHTFQFEIWSRAPK